MSNPEDPIEPQVAPPEATPPAPAPPSFGVSGSIRDEPYDDRSTSAPSSPWWAPENLANGAEPVEPAGEREPPPEEPAAPPAAPPPPVPDWLVAGPGVPPADTRRGLPMQPPAPQPPPGLAGPHAPDPYDTLPEGMAPVPPAVPPRLPDAVLPPGAVLGAPIQPGVPPRPGIPPQPGIPTQPGGSARAAQPGGTATMPTAAPTMAAPGAAGPGAALRGRRRLVLMAAGGVAAVVIAVVGLTTLTGSSEPKSASSAATPSGRAAAPQQSAGQARPRGNPAPSIDNEKTDRAPLRLTDVFPVRPLPLGGRVYKQDKTSVNHDCTLVARGAMAEALVRGHCRGVVRATYVDTKKRFAVTAGVVAMPTRRLALAVRKAGDPSRYEWFRGMPGTVAKGIDVAGGYAASTVRGRYIIYSYTTYLDGHDAGAGDTLLATVGRQFVSYAVRPIERRSR
ncbi:MAG TPA: hypothetical protein VF069_25930 [Streptosporangiaceae bacterium]